VVSLAYKDAIWNKFVSLKVSFFFAWLMLNIRLTAKDNLIWRGILNMDSTLYSWCLWQGRNS
jgi:hypothetical protein